MLGDEVLQVGFESVELHRALDAIVHFRLEMHLNVGGNVRSASKRARANRAGKRAQVEMALHVRAKILASRELMLANVAFEWTKSGVDSQVDV